MRMNSIWTTAALGAVAMAFVGLAAPAQAQIADAFTFKNLVNVQSGPNGSVLTSSNPFFNAGLDMQNPGDFTTVTLTDPGPGSPENIPQTGPTSFGSGPGFLDQAAMDAAYPMGDYTLTAFGGTQGVQSETLHYTTDAYAQNTPLLDGASFDALQGLKTSQHALTVGFNAQSASSSATAAFTFFTIFGSNEGCAFLSTSATSCAIDPADLAKGATYTYQVDFSDRVESSPNGTLDGVDFDVRTIGTFTTAVPEPATWGMMLLGFGALGAAVRMRRRQLSGITSAV